MGMPCIHDYDTECLHDCDNCSESRDTAYCTGCQQAITVHSDCFFFDGDIYCEDCGKEIVDERVLDLDFEEKLELVDGRASTWEGYENEF